MQCKRRQEYKMKHTTKYNAIHSNYAKHLGLGIMCALQLVGLGCLEGSDASSKTDTLGMSEE